MVAFGDRAYVAAAPSDDVAAVAGAVETARIGVSGKATAIADGFGLAIKRLQDRPAESRVVILLSDGRDTSSAINPVAAARIAADLGFASTRSRSGWPISKSSPARGMLCRGGRGEIFRVHTTGNCVRHPPRGPRRLRRGTLPRRCADRGARQLSERHRRRGRGHDARRGSPPDRALAMARSALRGAAAALTGEGHRAGSGGAAMRRRRLSRYLKDRAMDRVHVR